MEVSVQIRWLELVTTNKILVHQYYLHAYKSLNMYFNELCHDTNTKQILFSSSQNNRLQARLNYMQIITKT